MNSLETTTFPLDQIVSTTGDVRCSNTVERLAEAIRFFEAEKSACREFMRGEPIATIATNWNVVRYCGSPRGWIKADGRIRKNHLPNAARMTGDLSE